MMAAASVNWQVLSVSLGRHIMQRAPTARFGARSPALGWLAFHHLAAKGCADEQQADENTSA